MALVANAWRGALAILVALFFAATVLVSVASTAHAAPAKKCQGNPENFLIVNGQCVSDGKAEHL
jgi:hypothetical protein